MGTMETLGTGHKGAKGAMTSAGCGTCYVLAHPPLGGSNV